MLPALSQQPGILIVILSHTCSFLPGISLPDIWVTDPKVQFIDDAKLLLDTQLYRVRGMQGVEWAVPLYKGSQRVRLANVGGTDQRGQPGPVKFVEGNLAKMVADRPCVHQANSPAWTRIDAVTTFLFLNSSMATATTE